MEKSEINKIKKLLEGQFDILKFARENSYNHKGIQNTIIKIIDIIMELFDYFEGLNDNSKTLTLKCIYDRKKIYISRLEIIINSLDANNHNFKMICSSIFENDEYIDEIILNNVNIHDDYEDERTDEYYEREISKWKTIEYEINQESEELEYFNVEI